MNTDIYDLKHIYSFILLNMNFLISLSIIILYLLINTTPSVPDNLGHFDPARVLRNLMKNELKKLVGCDPYI